MKHRSRLLVVAACALLVLSLYSLAGVLQAAMLFTGAKALRNANLWGSIAIVSLVGATTCLWLAGKSGARTSGKSHSRLRGAVGVVAVVLASCLFWPVIRDFFVIDRCLDSGGSFDYVLSVCDMATNHPHLSLPEYQGFRVVASLVLGLPGLLLLFGLMQNHRQPRNSAP